MKNCQLVNEKARPGIPTLVVYESNEPDEVDQDVFFIPVTGPIGQQPVERLFCGLAHDLVSGILVPDSCPQESERMCGLTGHKSLCLFANFDDPLWQLIRESVALERECETT